MPVDETEGRRADPAGRRIILALVPVAAFTGLTILFAIALGGGDPSKVPSALIGKTVPEFTLPPVEALLGSNGQVPGLDSEDFRRGEVSVVNVWASWCGPCREEHPYLMQLAARGDVAVVGINYKDQPENARRFLGLHGNPFAAVGSDSSGRTAVDWGVYGVPETFVVDGAGTIRYKHVGPLTAKALTDAVVPAIEAAKR